MFPDFMAILYTYTQYGHIMYDFTAVLVNPKITGFVMFCRAVGCVTHLQH
jgi:hypothetical protein